MAFDKILLTGGSGFLGREIKTEIEKNIVTLGRSTNNDIIMDLTNPDFHLRVRCDLVIHCSGLAHNKHTSSNIPKEQQFKIQNVSATNNLLMLLEKGEKLPRCFVFISSVAVYGQIKGRDIDESHPLSASDPYGKSKVEAESLIIEWCNKNNVTCTVLRLPLLVGPNPPGNMRTMINGIKKGYYFEIGGGKAIKSMVMATDVAKIILTVAEIGGIYNLTDGVNHTFKDLSGLIARQLRKSQPISIPYWLAKFIARMGDLIGEKAPINTEKLKKITSDLTFSDLKARQVFGWNPKNILQEFKI